MYLPATNIVYENYSKPCMSSCTTIDGETSQEDPTIFWQPIWSAASVSETETTTCVYCPGCLQIVKVGLPCQFTTNWRDRKYLAHRDCGVPDDIITEFTRKAVKVAQTKQKMRSSIKVGSREFFV